VRLQSKSIEFPTEIHTMLNPCSACDRLLGAATAATFGHIRLKSILDIAQIRHDQLEIARLTPLVRSAFAEYEEALKLFRSHWRSH
jgi:hypothetical protein